MGGEAAWGQACNGGSQRQQHGGLEPGRAGLHYTNGLCAIWYVLCSAMLGGTRGFHGAAPVVSIVSSPSRG